MLTKDTFDRLPSLDSMRMGVEYRFKVEMRGFAITLRPISMMETVTATQETAEYLEGLPVIARNRIAENVVYAKKVLMVASTSAPGVNDYKITGHIIDRMTPDEVSFLFKEYVSGCDKVNPGLEDLPADVVERLADQVKKTPSQAIELSFLELVNVCRKLATATV